MNRREFMAALTAGAVITAEGLWWPGKKTISIPSKKILTPNTVNFTVSGLEAGDRVYAAYADEFGGTLIFNETCTGGIFSEQCVYTVDREIIVRVRNGTTNPMRAFQTQATLTNKGIDLPIVRIRDL